MFNPNQYLKHTAGIFDLTNWLIQQEKEGKSSKNINNTIYISLFNNKYFALGLEKNKKEKKPFIALHNTTSTWFSLIQWDSICIKEKDLHIYFVSKIIKGDNENYSDIPSFAIALKFDTVEKINLLKKIKELNGREYYTDETDTLRINLHTKIFNLKVKKLSYDEEHLIKEEIVTYDDILNGIENKVKEKFIEKPEFLGEVNQNLESMKINEFFNSTKK